MLPNNILKTTRWQRTGALLLLSAAMLFSQGPQQGPPQQGPNPGDESGDNSPGRGVARVSLVAGDVTIRRGDSGEWIAAAPNAPLVVQDRVQTGVNSRTEVQMDSSNMVRVGPQGEIRFAELEYQRFVIQVAAGTV